MDKALYEFDRKLKSAKTAFHRKGDIIKNLSREVSELKELLRMSEENNQRWKHLFQLSREGQVSLDVADAEQGTRGHVPESPRPHAQRTCWLSWGCSGTGCPTWRGRWRRYKNTPSTRGGRRRGFESWRAPSSTSGASWKPDRFTVRRPVVRVPPNPGKGAWKLGWSWPDLHHVYEF